MFLKKGVLLAVLLLIAPLSATAYGHHQHSNGHHQKHPVPPVVTPPPVTVPTPVVVPPVGQPPAAGEVRFVSYTTGYSYWDNTPPGSADISNGILHSKAGGVGTYSDPITLAVGHSITGSKDTLDYPAGTKFYLPNLRRYFIVEDTCGDGASPQNGPCHTGYQGHVWLDVYVGGGSVSRSVSDNCMNNITDLHLVIQNPASNYKVVSGEVAGNCAQYGDTVLTQ